MWVKFQEETEPRVLIPPLCFPLALQELVASRKLRLWLRHLYMLSGGEWHDDKVGREGSQCKCCGLENCLRSFEILYKADSHCILTSMHPPYPSSIRKAKQRPRAGSLITYCLEWFSVRHTRVELSFKKQCIRVLVTASSPPVCSFRLQLSPLKNEVAGGNALGFSACLTWKET